MSSRGTRPKEPSCAPSPPALRSTSNRPDLLLAAESRHTVGAVLKVAPKSVTLQPAVLVVASTWTDWAQTVIAVGALMTAALVPLTAYSRRPRLSLSEDTEGVHSRVEGNGVPYLRLLVGNARRKRAAHGTRVVVEGYRPQTPHAMSVTLGHPSLGWPSAPEAEATATVVIFAGWSRPLGLGSLIRVQIDEDGNIMPTLGGVGHTPPDQPLHPLAVAARWYLWLSLAFGLSLTDNRDKLPPRDEGYAVQLVVGADDGTARRYDVNVNWNGDAEDARAALDSVQIAVRGRA